MIIWKLAAPSRAAGVGDSQEVYAVKTINHESHEISRKYLRVVSGISWLNSWRSFRARFLL